MIQGLIVHPFHAELYGLTPNTLRRDEVQIRSASAMLDRILALDARPLSSPRPPERRFVGNCRHFTVLLCAFLRAHGASARARCGFGAYFGPLVSWITGREVWTRRADRRLVVPSSTAPARVDQIASIRAVPRRIPVGAPLAARVAARPDARTRILPLFVLQNSFVTLLLGQARAAAVDCWYDLDRGPMTSGRAGSARPRPDSRRLGMSDTPSLGLHDRAELRFPARS